MKIFVKLVLLIIAVALGRFGYEKVIDLPYFELKEIIVEGDSFIPKDSLVSLGLFLYFSSVYYVVTCIMLLNITRSRVYLLVAHFDIL